MHLKFEISDALGSDLKKLAGDAELASQRELFANMVALWRWASDRSKEGKAIVALDEQTKRYNELALPALVKVRFKS